MTGTVPAPRRCPSGIARRHIITLVAAVLAVAGSPGSSLGDAIEQISGGALSLQQRMDLRCPSVDASGPFAEPIAVTPSPEMVISATYSDGSDLVRLAGDDAPIYSDLGTGNDFAFLHDVGPGWSVTGGSGADTILLCSMEDLSATVQLGAWTGDSDPDVVVIEGGVFTNVPAQMLRHLNIFEYDPAYDRLIIHAPAALLEGRQSSTELGGIRIGDVIIKIHTQQNAAQLQLGGPEVESVTFLVSDGESGAGAAAPASQE